jgi:LPXTG-motif cell wall-anchored protein
MKRTIRLFCAAFVAVAATLALAPIAAHAGTIGASCAVGGVTAVPGHLLITSLHGELRNWPDNGTPTTLRPDGSIADRWRLDMVSVIDSSPAAPGGHLLPFTRVDPFTFDITATSSAVWPIKVTFFHHNIRPDLSEYQDPPRTVTLTQDGLPCSVVAAPTTTTPTTTPTTTATTTAASPAPTSPTTTAVAPTATTVDVLGAGATVPAAGLPATGSKNAGGLVAVAALLVGTGWLLTRWGRPSRSSDR